MIASTSSSVLAVIDVQEKLCPVMSDPRRVIWNCSRLMSGAAQLNVPTLLTEQYPEGIGPTIVDLRDLAAPDTIIPKRTFSAVRDEGFIERLESLDRHQVILAGIESHVCVQQTALELAAKGYQTFVVRDACASRRHEDEEAAFRRMERNGCEIVTTEMVLFEWLGDSRNPAFRTMLSRLIK